MTATNRRTLDAANTEMITAVCLSLFVPVSMRRMRGRKLQLQSQSFFLHRITSIRTKLES